MTGIKVRLTMAESQDEDLLKICHHSNQLCRRIIGQVSLSLVFRLLVTFVLTTVVIETVFLLTGGAVYISSQSVNVITDNRHNTVKSRSVLFLLNDEKSENISSTSISKTSDGNLEAANTSKSTSKPSKRTDAYDVTTSVTSQNDTKHPPPKAPPAAVKNSNDVYNRVMVDYFTYLENLCSRKAVVYPRDKKKLCPCISPFLQGAKPVQQENIPTVGELELQLSELQDGGHFVPRFCHPRHHVTIIVPFRDREEHLNIFLNHLHPFLQRQLIEYRIFVVEEVPHKIFNKAMMMNIGFEEALKIAKNTDCVIFHDVDMLPENDFNLYACTDVPRHIGAFVDKWNYNLPYSYLFGGVISMTPQQFRLVNGYSNEFFGWGGEDDDFHQRVKAQGLKIERYPKEVSKYTMLKHQRDKLNPTNSRRGVSVLWRPQHYAVNGLNSLKYYIKTIENRPLYTWIQADIDIS